MILESFRRVVPIAVLVVASVYGSAHAQTGYVSNFEALSASPAGTPLWVGSSIGQEGYYGPPTTTSIAFRAYTYAGNTLGVPPNPSGGGNVFIGGTGPGDPIYARAQRAVSLGSGTGPWTFATDVLIRFTGTLPTTQNAGNFWVQPEPTGKSFSMLATWSNVATAANWNADYKRYDIAGTEIQDSPGPGFQGLLTNRWYRWETGVDLATNQIIGVRIKDLTTNTTFNTNPVGWFVRPGATPTTIRFTAGGFLPGNATIWDNIAITPGWVSALPPKPGPGPCTVGPCCFPDNSLRVTSLPVIGGTVSYAADLPTAGTSLFATVGLFFSFVAGQPCGVLFPGITNQSVMIGLPAVNQLFSGPWFGPGSPVVFTVPVPPIGTLIGASLHAQGAFVSASLPFVMTEGASVALGGY